MSIQKMQAYQNQRNNELTFQCLYKLTHTKTPSPQLLTVNSAQFKLILNFLLEYASFFFYGIEIIIIILFKINHVSNNAAHEKFLPCVDNFMCDQPMMRN